MSESKPEIENEASTGGHPGWDVEPVVEQIWGDLGGIVTRPAIRLEIEQVLPAFEGARITTYVPLFVRRRTVARLRTGWSGVTPQGHA